MDRRYDAIICDIDGCLGPESHAPLDIEKLVRVAEHNRRAISQGDRPVLTLCSGRPQPYAEAICRVIGNTALPVVCEMGVWLYDPRDNRYLFDPSITAEDLDRVEACTRWVRRELEPRGVVMQPGKTASISLWHPDTALLMSLKPAIAERVAREGWKMRVASTVAWINLELEHVGKASGIQRLKSMCGLTTARLAGIGDTLGDLAIREHVAFFACPANGDERIKAEADYVSPHEELEGVLDAIGFMC